MSWWNAQVPIWQVVAMLTAYSAYREIVKILVKLIYKKGLRHVQDRKARRVQPALVERNSELPSARTAYFDTMGFVYKGTPTYSRYRPRKD